MTHEISPRSVPCEIGTRRYAGAGYIAVLLLSALTAPVSAQAPATADPVTLLKQSLQTGAVAIRQYQWVETTTLSLKGEEKSRQENQCYYGADGTVQKTPVAAPPPPESGGRAQRGGGGVRGRVVENKTDDMKGYLADAVALVTEYVPPDPARIQAAKDAGKVSVTAPAGGRQQLAIRDYLKAGDVLTVTIDPVNSRLLGLNVASYLTNAKDAVTLDVTMNTLADAALYPSSITLDGQAESVRVNIQNSGHTK